MTTIEDNSTIVDTTESQLTPEPAEASAPEETKAQAETPKRKRGQSASSNGNGHRPASEQEAALALAESVEGQFETVRSNALDALGTLRKQRDILDESIQSLEGIVERYAGPGEVAEPAAATKTRSVAPKPSAKPARKTSGRAPKRTKADMQSAIDKIVALLQKKGAMKTEAIREALDIPKVSWLTTAKHLKADKRVKVSGEKRATTFAVRG